MDLGMMILLLLLAGVLIGGIKAYQLRSEWAAFQQWRFAGMPAAPQTAQNDSSAQIAQSSVSFDPATLPGAGRALAHPPANFRSTLAALRAQNLGRYGIPLGWEQGGIVTAKLVGDVNHILITGQSDSGKDNATMGMFYALAAQNPPSSVQFAIIDGKGLDWAAWAKKAHTWRLALSPEDIAPAMAALTNERQRRLTILQSAGVTKWDTYQRDDLPLLVVYISELLLLQNATSGPKLTAWLNSELTAARAFGIRYVIATQTASNFDTQWRSQISLFLAGFQPTPTQDMPNVGMTTKELEAIGAIPPSQLPAPPAGAGVFTAVQGRHVAIARATFLDDNQRAQLLALLPDKPTNHQEKHNKSTTELAPSTTSASDLITLHELLQSGQPLPFADEARSAAISLSNAVEVPSVASSSSSGLGDELSVKQTVPALVVAAEVVPPEEQRRILEAARSLTSRRQVSLKLYEASGGAKYTWVQLVCDAAGLLPTQKAA